jgi:methyl-accepting chemotaxis protein
MLHETTLRTKLALGFGALVLALAATSVVSYYSLDQISYTTEKVDAAVQKKELVMQMQLAVERQKTGIRDLLLLRGEKNSQDLDEGRRAFRNAADKFSPLLETEQGKKLFRDLVQTSTQYQSAVDRVAELAAAGKTKEAVALAYGADLRQLRESVAAGITAFLQREDNRKKEAQDAQQTIQTRSRWTVLLLAAAGLVIGSTIAILVPRSLSQSLSGMMTLIHEIANNNLSVDDLIIASSDELGRASEALNTMKNNLENLIHTISETAEHVASVSEKISNSATQQAERAETQEGQALQVASAMQQMSVAVNDVSQNSQRAAEASHQAAETARQGGTIVENSLAKMRGIADSVSATAKTIQDLGKSSEQIGHIIGVINDIADQTNLLALNAAIEAARAGEQGRGFAVVADEVRKLAERTTIATKEVAQMVRNIQEQTKTAVAAMQDGTKQVQHGVATTTQAGGSLKQIIQVSEQVGEMISHIATASTEQSSATEQVNQNVEQITRLLKESAVGAKQSATACQDLSGLALDLTKMVGHFNVQAKRPGGVVAWQQESSENGESRDTRAFAGRA